MLYLPPSRLSEPACCQAFLTMPTPKLVDRYYQNTQLPYW